MILDAEKKKYIVQMQGKRWLNYVTNVYYSKCNNQRIWLYHMQLWCGVSLYLTHTDLHIVWLCCGHVYTDVKQVMLLYIAHTDLYDGCVMAEKQNVLLYLSRYFVYKWETRCVTIFVTHWPIWRQCSGYLYTDEKQNGFTLIWLEETCVNGMVNWCDVYMILMRMVVYINTYIHVIRCATYMQARVSFVA